VRPAGTAALVLAGAARAVSAVLVAGRNADAALMSAAGGAQRAAIRAVTLGTLRWYLRLTPAVLPLTGKLEPALQALLVCAAHQLEYSAHAPASTVAASVDAARLLGHERAAGLINAVLRRYLREHAALLAGVDRDLAARTAHPQWLVGALEAAWPSQCAQILDANNAHPPLCLRLDLTRVGRAQYLASLEAAGIAARAVPGIDTAVTLELPLPVEDIPGFAAGQVSVQDASAQLAALLLAPVSGERVLDACAAPGGKSGALLECASGPIELIALDREPARVRLIGENLERLGRRAALVSADLRAPPVWWDGRPFDAILLDAPCSATGVIRRHPDIKLLRRAVDVPALADTQLALLRACWPLLRPGGRLLYCTCSVLPEENARVIDRFLAAEGGASPRPLEAAGERCPPLRPAGAGWQMLAGESAGGDGFYYACLTRTRAA